ncbi:MAG: ATP-binding protein [Spirochaetota bacterium]
MAASFDNYAKIVAELLAAPGVESICDYLGEIVKRESGADYLVVGIYDPVSGMNQPRAVLGLGDRMKSIMGRLRSDPLKVRFGSIPADTMPDPELFRRHIEKVEGGIGILMKGKVNRSVCAAAEAMLGITGVWGMGLFSGNNVYGSVSFIFCQGRTPEKSSFIESLVNMAALVLERRIAEYDSRQDEQKQVADLLEQSRERYRELVETLPVTIFETDIRGNVTYANPAGYSLFGYDPDDVANGLSIFTMLAPEEIEKARERVGRIVSGAVTDTTNDYSIVRKDGAPRRVRIQATIVRNDSTPVGIRGIALDITEVESAEQMRRQHEQMLIQSDKLMSLGEMAAGLAHEINQPLTVISLASANAEYGADDRHPDLPRVREKLIAVRHAVARIRTLIDHVRAFSRDEELRGTTFSVHEAIENARALFSAQYREHEIDVSTDLGCTVPTAMGNSFRFEQVIINLLSNAKYAIDEKRASADAAYRGTIQIRTGETKNHIYAEMNDNGCGMSAAVLGRIFEPFFTTKPVSRGTGLGLSICYAIIRDMNGEITATSEVGAGTTFIIILPKQGAEAVHGYIDDTRH